MCDVSSVINWCKMNSSPERQQLINSIARKRIDDSAEEVKLALVWQG